MQFRAERWLAQELLQALGNELDQVALVPGRGGVFVVRVNQWSRGLFPP